MRRTFPTSGITFATGSPDLLMITSSPVATASRILEKWVFASWTLYCRAASIAASHG